VVKADRGGEPDGGLLSRSVMLGPVMLFPPARQNAHSLGTSALTDFADLGRRFPNVLPASGAGKDPLAVRIATVPSGSIGGWIPGHDVLSAGAADAARRPSASSEIGVSARSGCAGVIFREV